MRTRTRLPTLLVGLVLALLVGDAEPDPVRFLAVVDDAPAVAHDLRLQGAGVRLVTETTVDTVVATATPRQLERLGRDARVREVTVLGEPRRGEFDVVRDAPEALPTHQPIVYVLDSRVDFENEWFTDDDADLVAADGYSLYTESDDRDCARHGTGVASVIAGRHGLVRGVTVVPITVVCGWVDLEALLGGLEWVADNHPEGVPAVLNASLTLPDVPALAQAVVHLTDLGIAQFWSAGNAGIDACSKLRASTHEHIFIVGSTTKGFDVETNYGPCVDAFAVGERIVTGVVGENNSNRMSGTSLSSPRVASIGLRILQEDPDLTAHQVYERVLAGSEQGRIRHAGEGSPDRYLRLDNAGWHYEGRHAEDERRAAITAPREQPPAGVAHL